MKRILPGLLLLACGCIENGLTSTVPVGVANPRDLPVSIKEDKVVQVRIPEVDVLWVIDNSCSMYEEQTALAENFPIFMNYFLDSGLDYHIGVVSTDMLDLTQSGRLREVDAIRFLNVDTKDPVGVFGDMAVIGTSGSFDERGREAARAALDGLANGYNEGFQREDAAMHIVVISDEDDHSVAPLSEFIDWLRNLKWSDELVTFSSIVSPDPVCDSALQAGIDYLAVTAAVGGISWSICNEDWGEVLEQLGIQASGLQREYFLSALPVPGTITVKVVEEGVPSYFDDRDFTYSPTRNSITFTTFVPSALAEVYVNYEELASVAGRL